MRTLAEFFSCDLITKTEFNDRGYVVTTRPGSQSPLYFLDLDASTLPDIYPAHRVLSDGRKLADVPAAEWTTLPEIAENPIGAGPYVLKEWVKGEKMVFEANPYYYGGAPKTKNIVISFVASALVGLFYGPLFPGIMAIASRWFVHALGIVSSVMLVSTGAAGMILPALMGVLIPTIGVNWVMVIPAAACLLIAIPLILAIRQQGHTLHLQSDLHTIEPASSTTHTL